MRLNDSLPEDNPDRLAIYMPGATVWRGRRLRDELHLNPLEIVWPTEETAPPILSHVDRLKSIINASFPMQEVLPILLEEVLFWTYQVKGWLSQTPPAFGTPAPSLTDLVNIIDPHMRSKGYEKSIVENLSAALKTRLQSLQRGWKGQLFNPPDGRSTPWGELFDRPAVVNLSCLGDDADKAFAMAVLILFLYEYRQAQHDLAPQPDADGADLRHLTVIEEAHRILRRVAPGTPEHANPQGKVAEMFANALSEIRAYRQGFLIVDQVPARLVPDAVKNTNLKIVHRLVADDDRQAMASCMSLTADQTAIINRLRPGQAIVAGDQDDRAAWIQILMQGPHASVATGAS